MNEDTKKLLNTFAARYGFKYEDFESSTAFFATLLIKVLDEELKFHEHVNDVFSKLQSGEFSFGESPIKTAKDSLFGLPKVIDDAKQHGTGIYRAELNEEQTNCDVVHVPVEDFFETIVKEIGLQQATDYLDGMNASCSADMMVKAEGLNPPTTHSVYCEYHNCCGECEPK